MNSLDIYKLKHKIVVYVKDERQGPIVDATFSWCTDYSLQLST